MHFHLPKPLHGWREFVGEVGIIVIGVLIALGAEQVVETLHWKEQVAGFRAAVRHELANDLGSYVYRSREDHCVERRLDELQAWLASWQAGQPLRLARPIGVPNSLSLDSSAWQSRDINIVSHLPLDEKLQYGVLYDEFANNEVHRLDERQTWLELAQYNGADKLDHSDIMHLQGLIYRGRYRNEHMRTNFFIYMKEARNLGIEPATVPDAPLYDTGFCQSLFSPGPKAGN